MVVFFNSALLDMASGTQVMKFIIFGLTGTNFVIELAVNMLLAASITRVVKVLKKY